MANLPGLGLAVQPPSSSSSRPSQVALPPSRSSSDAARFFNTYLYDYLLKQGLLDVARVFVTSGAELELLSPSDSSLPPHLPTHTTPPNPSNSSPPSIAHGPPNDSSVHSKAVNPSNTTHSTNPTPTSLPSSTEPRPPPNGIAPPSASSLQVSPRSPSAGAPSAEGLPRPKLAMDTDQGFLFEWWTIFWDVFRAKTGRGSAPAQPARLYAQSIAAASLGTSVPPGGITKARREAMGIVAMPNPADIQKGQVADRFHQQQYALVNSPVYPPHAPPELGTPTGPMRLSPHPQLQHLKHPLLVEQAARQQHMQRLQQQQQQQQTALARQRFQQQELQQHQHRQKQEAHLQQQQHQHHHAQQLHQLFPDQFGAQQRQISISARRPGLISSMGPEQVNGMMPPPTIQHGLPINSQHQMYRLSRPPSRTGSASHAPSPFGLGHPPPHSMAPQREPSRAPSIQANANSPAHNPRTPNTVHHPLNIQTAVLPPNKRSSPTPANEEQGTKKRRLSNHGSIGRVSQPDPIQGQSAHQSFFQQHQQQAHNVQQQKRGNRHGQHVDSSLVDVQNVNGESPPKPLNSDAFALLSDPKHNQVAACATSNSTAVPSPPASASPKRNTGVIKGDAMPTSGHNPSQAPTPQATPLSARPAEQQSAPPPNASGTSLSSYQTSQSQGPAANEANCQGSSSMTQTLSGASQPQPSLGWPEKVPVTGAHSSASEVIANGHSGEKTHGVINGDSVGSHTDTTKVKADDVWSVNLVAGSGQQVLNGNGGPGKSSPPGASASGAQPPEEVPMIGTNSMEQLFGPDDIGFDIDTTLFEAFINYDPTASDLGNPDFP